MKTKIKVTELTHEEIVDLLSTALYGSEWFVAKYDENLYESLKNKDGICFEDKLADMLLAGHKITIVDVYSGGVSYSNKCVGVKNENVYYEIDLKDILKKASTIIGYELISDVLSGDGDYYTADEFLQRVVFGEVIYG